MTPSRTLAVAAPLHALACFIFVFVFAACGGIADRAEPSAEAGVVADSGRCIDIDPSNYDQSCVSDADCIDEVFGAVCSGDYCLCGAGGREAINVSGKARYLGSLASVGVTPSATPNPAVMCDCPADWAAPRCLKGKCGLCGNVPNRGIGCGDGG